MAGKGGIAMRVPSNEFLPAQMGLTNDPMIHHNLIQGSKDKKKKGSTLAVVLSFLLLAGLIGFVIWGVVGAH